jgi:ABC-type iron transport system FetAB ATPase subunit
VLKVDRLALSGMPLLSFDVAAGECLAIEGPSGSGKTRILRALADLDPAGGYVYIEGAERAEVAAPVWRQRVRYVSAEPAWWAATPRDHVTRQPEAQRFERMALSLGLTAAVLDRPMTQLSTGERLRLGLARALADEPPVILLDEPTAALDGEARAHTEELIRFQVLARRAVVLVSHDADQVDRLADKRLQLAPAKPVGPPPAAVTVPPRDERLAALADRWGRE